MSHYTTLGIAPDASAEEIRRAYRILARRYHPDVNPGMDSKSKFQKISEAYTVLSDPSKRSTYDTEIRVNQKIHSARPASARKRPQPSTPFQQPKNLKNPKRGFFDEVKDIFKEVSTKVSKTKKTQARPPTPQKVSVLELSLEIKEAIRGGVKQVELAEPEGRRTISITVPAGVKTGDIIRLNGKHSREDLVAVVRLLPDPVLSITRKGIIIETPVTLEEAMFGASITVPTLDEPVVLKIPAQTQNGSELRIKGKGVPNRSSGEKGDLVYKISIRIPENASATALAAAKILTPEYGKESVRSTMPKTLV